MGEDGQRTEQGSGERASAYDEALRRRAPNQTAEEFRGEHSGHLVRIDRADRTIVEPLAGHSMQQERPKSCRTMQSVFNLSDGLLLGRIELNSLMLNHGNFSKRVTAALDLFNL